MTLLITGSAGLIGTALTRYLEHRGTAVVGVDLRTPSPDQCDDVAHLDLLSEKFSGITGVVHLAAVSRVIDGERDPARCWRMNVEVTRRLLENTRRVSSRPWFIYASSREVYGLQKDQPVAEDAPLQPLNVYARSKLAAEGLVSEARESGVSTSILRFANVYGSITDHIDRVVPAFVSAGVAGGVLRVDGGDCIFDLNHVDDVVRGIAMVIEQLSARESDLPPLHFVSGRGTSLFELATMCRKFGNGRAQIHEAPSRNFDVHQFVGDPRRAQSVLGWRSTIDLASGLSRLAQQFASKSR